MDAVKANPNDARYGGELRRRLLQRRFNVHWEKLWNTGRFVNSENWMQVNEGKKINK